MSCNNIGKRFVFFEWSAPCPDTPQEVVAAAADLHLEGKTVAGISAIGHVSSVCDDVFPLLLAAGMDATKSWPEIEDVMPCEIWLYEPLQITFTDGTTLELLPMEHGGAKIAVNSIPAGLTTGLSHNNIPLQALFGEHLTGRQFDRLQIRVCQNTELYTDHAQLKEDTSIHQYIYRISFNAGCWLELTKQDNRSNYRLRLYDYGREIKVPYAQVDKVQRNDKHIPIYPGHKSGGSMWITPVPEADRLWDPLPYSYKALSMWDMHCWDFLRTLLNRYFDISIQNRSEEDEQIFDWYGDNLYTVEAVRKLLADVRRIAGLLAEDYDAPELDELKAGYNPYTFGYNGERAQLSDTEKAALIRKNIHIAIDFYNRFAQSVEIMLDRAGDCSLVIFSGP